MIGRLVTMYTNNYLESLWKKEKLNPKMNMIVQLPSNRYHWTEVSTKSTKKVPKGGSKKIDLVDFFFIHIPIEPKCSEIAQKILVVVDLPDSCIQNMI